MDYSNPEIPEGINYSKTHPLKEFLLLTTGVLASVIPIFVALAFFADRLVQYIPFAMEKDIDIFVMEDNNQHPQMITYLQQLADQVAQTQGLEKDMQITVHYVDSDVVNAYATLGGNVVFFRGLLEKMSNENALAMIMAHEIAHVKHRHPIRSLSKGVVIGIALSLVNRSMSDAIIGEVMGNTGSLTLLKYSRNQETEADETALASLNQMYAHVHGADALFKYLQQQGEKVLGYQPEFLTTHPDVEKRIARIKTISATQQQSDLKPLPADYKTWLEQTSQQ